MDESAQPNELATDYIVLIFPIRTLQTRDLFMAIEIV